MSSVPPCRNEAGWPGPSPLAGQRDLRSYSAAAASCRCCAWRAVIRRPRTAAAIRQRRGSHGTEHDARNRSGRVPAAQRARLAPPAAAKASARSAVAFAKATSLASQPRCDIAVFERSTVARSDIRRSEAVRIGPTLSAVTAQPLKRTRSGTHRRRRGFVSSSHLSRCRTDALPPSGKPQPTRGTVSPPAGGAFPRREAERRADRFAPASHRRRQRQSDGDLRAAAPFTHAITRVTPPYN